YPVILPGRRRGERAGDGGHSAGDQARAPRTGRQAGPACGIVYGARLEIEQPAAGHAGGRGAMIGTMGAAVGAGAVAGGAAGRGAGGVVARPRLAGRLAARARVNMVSAPPGSGKTVLLRSWISQSGVAGSAAWVPAGRGERDPQRFWLSVLAALRQTG